MNGLPRLALAHALHHRGRTAILVACIALSILLPATTEVVLTRYRADLVARANDTPLLVGARGNRFDLTLAALYFRQSRLENVPWALAAQLTERGAGLAVPLHARYRARGFPVVGTTLEYFERRALVAANGTLPVEIGDAVLGADVAQELGLGPGDELFSDPTELYDIAKGSAHRLGVCGVLARAGTPDDQAVFVDLKTAWILEGLAHGHPDVVAEDALPEGFVLSRSEDSVAVSPALIEHNRVTPGNVADFHFHGERTELPLSAVLFFPDDDKAGTLAKAEINAAGIYQMVVPRQVIADLMAFVFRIKSLFDSVSAVLIGSTILFTLLVMLLTVRLRASEFRTLHAIGCGRRATLQLLALEVGGIVSLAVLVAACGSVVAAAFLPDLMRTL